MNKFFIVFLILFPLNLFSNDLRFNKFGTKNGLDNESAYKLIEDEEGFIWIGTYDGLDRFDGVRFKSYKPDEQDSTSLPGNMILDLMLDKDKNLWISTNQGICMYNRLLDRFQRRITAANLDSFYIKTFTQDHKGNFWIGKGKYIIEIGPDYKLIQVVDPNPNESESDQNSVLSIKEDNDGLIWIVKKDAIYSYDPKTKTNRQYTDFGNIGNFYGVSIDTYGNVWLGNYTEPVVYIKKLDRCFSVFSPDCPIKLPRVAFSTVTDDKKGNLWLSALGFGLIKFNIETETYKTYNYDKNNPFSIAEGPIEYTYFDRKGNLWCVGNTCGLNVSYKDNRPFNIIRDINNTQASIFRSPITAIIEDTEGNIWFGTEGQGITVWNPVTQSIKEYKNDIKNPYLMGGNGIFALYRDSKGNIWAGGYGSGLNKYNSETDNFISFKADKQPPYNISCDDVRSITEDSEGNIWAVTCCGGVNVYNPVTFDHQVINLQNSGILNDYDLKIYLDDKNQAWIGTYSGLSIYNITDKTVKNYVADKKIPGSLPDQWVYCVYKDTKGRYWIGTQGGLALFNEETEKFKSFTEKQGLPSKTIMSIVEDDSSKLWIATTNGICKFDPEKETFLNYSTDDGLPDLQYRMNSAIKASDGQIYMGSKNGVVFFDPMLINQIKDKAPVFFTDLYINNKYIQPGKSSILKKSLNYSEKIKLKHNENFLRIDFVALSYFHAEKNTYAYKLEGVDEDWVFNGTDNNASYTNLKHGNYTFYVKAFNSDGYPSDIRSIKIRIRPAWYNTLFFYFILLTLAIYLIYRYITEREQKAKRDKEILEQKIAEGQKEISEKMHLLEIQQKEIQERDYREKEIKFHNEGIARFSDIFSQKRKDVKELSTSLVSELVKYVGANAGLVFVSDDSDPERIKLQISGEYCYDTDKTRKEEFIPGEGYVGTCYIEKNLIEIDDLPAGFIVLNSGLGRTDLKYDIFVPVVQENICLAVIEIASIEKLPKYKISFIEKIADNFSSVIAIQKANERMQKMLNENISQSEILKSQEEELRQNLEEMHATQEDLRRQMENATIARQDLEKEKVLIDTLLRNAQESIYFKDRESRFIKVSDSMKRVFNVKNVDDIIGKSDFDFFTEEHARPAYADEMEIIRTGTPLLNKVEKETHADGRITYVSTSKMPLYDHNKEIIGTFGISKDVTDLVNMEMEISQRNEELQAQEEELRQNLEEMQTVQENLEAQISENRKMHDELSKEKYLMDALLAAIPEHIYIKDKESRFIKFSKSMMDIFFIDDPNDLIGKTDFDFFDETHARPAFEDEQQIMSTGEPILNKIEKEIKKDGTVNYVSTSKLPLYDENHNIVGTFGISKDITDLVNMEIDIKQRNEELQAQDEELRQNLEEMHTIQESLENQIVENTKTQERLEFENIMFTTLMDNISARITYKDDAARYIRINKMKQDALGIKDQLEVMGKTDLDVFVGTHTKDRLEKEIEQIRAGASSLHVEEFFKQKDGTMGWGDVNRIPLRNKAGKIVGGLVITWDITDKKNMKFLFEQDILLLNKLSENLPIIIFSTDSVGSYIEIKGEGLKALGLKNKKEYSENIPKIFPEIEKLLKKENSKDVEELTGNTKFNNKMINYKSLLIRNKALSGGFTGFILLKNS